MAALAAAAAAALALAGTGGAESGRIRVDPPAGPGSMGPNLLVAGNEVLLSWLEPMRPGSRPGEADMALRYAAWNGRGWSAPQTIATGGKFFANWADFPAIGRAAGGWLLAAWPEKSGEGAYDYRLELARAPGPKGPWRRIGPANEDRGPGEHGFVSLVPDGDGVRAFWLDGREMKGEAGSMTLRTALVRERVEASERLDARVCDCCQTAAAATAGGPVVAYRDRSDAEVRDLSIVRRTAGAWTAPRPIAPDGWKIDGCPVNGPAAAAAGQGVAVAWFTASGQRPRVRIAFSCDGGATFGNPVDVDGANPAGRVGLALDGNGDALVSWVAAEGSSASIRLRRVEPNGRAGEALTVAPTSLARSSGVPRIARRGDTILVAWVETGDPFRLRAAAVRAADLPRLARAR